MKKCELLKDEAVIHWIDFTVRSEHTRKSYLNAIEIYTEFHKMSPSALLEEAEQEEANRVVVRLRKLSNRLINFRKELENKKGTEKLAPLTIKTRIAAIRSFYKSNGVTLPPLPRAEAHVHPLAHTQTPCTKEDIQTILEYVEMDIRDRALILAEATSGLAISDLCELKIKTFKDDYDETDQVTTIKHTRVKTDVNLVTFFTPEATAAIWDYLNWRDRRNKSDVRQCVYSDEGYLFIAERVPENFLAEYDDELRKLTPRAIMTKYRELANDTGKAAGTGLWNPFRSHNLRKFMNSTLKNKGINPDMLEFMLGHALPGSKAPYWWVDPTELKIEYKKYMHHLTIQKKLDVTISPEYKEAVKRAEKAEAEAVRVSVERDEINKLKAQLENMTADFEIMCQAYEQDIHNKPAPEKPKSESRQKLRRVEFLPDDGAEDIF